MAATSMVHVRVDEHLKTQATETLAAMGLSVSDAVRVFLTRVVAEQRLPFALKAPNADTRAAMEEARTIRKARFASAKDLIVDLEKGAKRLACGPAAGVGPNQSLRQGLDPADALGPLRHEAP